MLNYPMFKRKGKHWIVVGCPADVKPGRVLVNRYDGPAKAVTINRTGDPYTTITDGVLVEGYMA